MAFWTGQRLNRAGRRRGLSLPGAAPLVGRPFQAVSCGGPETAWKGRPTVRRRSTSRSTFTRRKGAASIDYVLILGVILPLVGISIVMSRQIMGLVYEVFCVLVSWPFM